MLSNIQRGWENIKSNEKAENWIWTFFKWLIKLSYTWSTNIISILKPITLKNIKIVEVNYISKNRLYREKSFNTEKEKTKKDSL